MKALIVALAFFAASVGLARADQPGPDWMPIPQVAHELHSMGFTDIGQIKADDGHWKVHAVRDGQLYKVDLDPYSGRIIGFKLKHEDHEDYDEDHDEDHD